MNHIFILVVHIGLKLLFALALKTHQCWEIKRKLQKVIQDISNAHENKKRKTKERAKHFIINEKAYLLHFNFQQFVFIYKNYKEGFLELCSISLLIPKKNPNF
jgi:hypothetical protein